MNLDLIDDKYSKSLLNVIPVNVVSLLRHAKVPHSHKQVFNTDENGPASTTRSLQFWPPMNTIYLTKCDINTVLL
jgi:hypothetical protein